MSRRRLSWLPALVAGLTLYIVAPHGRKIVTADDASFHVVAAAWAAEETGHGGPGAPSPQAAAAAAGEHGDVHAESDTAAHQAGGHGDGGHGSGVDGKTLALQLFNFGVLIFILVWFGGRAINKALAARHERLKVDLAAAAEARAAAEAKLTRQEARLASLEQEIEELRRSIKAEADAEKGRLIAAAEERAARIKAETTFMLEQQVKEAEVRLRREAADAGLRLAEETLRRAVGATDQQKMLDAFVTKIGAPGSTAAATPPAGPARPAPPAAGRSS